mmetsp:Transcript_57325/g.131590  ORF Transcript_57325/g.131590 Transcript_57325/m.131590 type:complete len:211 (-) Transcript_57325:28-660(-)
MPMMQPVTTPQNPAAALTFFTSLDMRCCSVSLGSASPRDVAKRSMKPWRSMPVPLEKAFPSAAAASVDKPNITPMLPSMASPIMTMSALSVQPKPMYGSMVVRNRIRSWSGVAGAATVSRSAEAERTLVDHLRNSPHVSTPSAFVSARANSSSSSPTAQERQAFRRVSDGSARISASSSSGCEARRAASAALSVEEQRFLRKRHAKPNAR